MCTSTINKKKSQTSYLVITYSKDSSLLSSFSFSFFASLQKRRQSGHSTVLNKLYPRESGQIRNCGRLSYILILTKVSFVIHQFFRNSIIFVVSGMHIYVYIRIPKIVHAQKYIQKTYWGQSVCSGNLQGGECRLASTA